MDSIDEKWKNSMTAYYIKRDFPDLKIYQDKKTKYYYIKKVTLDIKSGFKKIKCILIHKYFKRFF